jgi:hypothetical protein
VSQREVEQGRHRWVSMVALAALAGLVLATALAPSRAAADGIETGATSLQLDRGLAAVLKEEGVRLSGIQGGKVKGRVVSLPVKGGLIDLGTANGWVDSAGALKLRSGKRVARLTEITLDTSKGVLRGKLDGQGLRISVVKSYTFTRNGFGDDIHAKGLRLTGRAVKLLNRKLGLNGVFRPGRPFASVSSSIQPYTAQVTGGSLQIAFDPGTLAKIRSLDVEVQTLESSLVGSEPLTFSAPAIKGEVDPDMTNTWGAIEGGFRIDKPEAPGPAINWWNLGVSFGEGRVLSNPHVRTESGGFSDMVAGPFGADLSAATVSVDPATRTVSVSNVKATLGVAAGAINELFAKPQGKDPAVAASDPLGTISMTLQGR